jgi:hypothetical protein
VKISRSRMLRLVVATSLTLMCLVAVLVPAAWATPDQERVQQTIPTRTPDRGARTPKPTKKPSPTFTAGTEASPPTTLVPSTPTPTQTWTPLLPNPTETETPVPPSATPTSSPRATETALPSPTATPTPVPPTATPALTPSPTATPPTMESVEDISPASVVVEIPPTTGLGPWGLIGGAGLVVIGLYLLLSRPHGRW